MNYIKKLLIEATFVGVAIVILGSLIGFIVGKYYPKVDLPPICSTYNKFFIMEFTLFLTGFLLHLICEFSGINLWYLKNGAVLLKK